MTLPALDEGGEPVNEEVHEELGGKEGSEGEVDVIEGRVPVRFLERVTDLRFYNVHKEIL